MEAGSCGWNVFSPSCCLSWKHLLGEATSPVLRGGGEGGQPRLCERGHSCSPHLCSSQLWRAVTLGAVQQQNVWAAQSEHCIYGGKPLGSTSRWHYSGLPDILRSAFVYSKTELEMGKTFYMISICIFFYFCHSETLLAAVLMHEIPKAAYYISF